MSPLNIHPEEAVNVPKKKKNKSLKVMLGIAALVAVPVVGTTLAASITINSGGGVQFGQGVTLAAACDSAITLTPAASFVNSDNTFKLATITIAGLNGVACNGKTLTIKALKSDGTEQTVSAVSDATTKIVITLPADAVGETSAAAPTIIGSGADYTISSGTVDPDTAGDATFTIQLGSNNRPASGDVDKFTIESS
jgi:hypothetical protein